MDVGSVSAAASQTVKSRQTLAGNFDTFLRLLTAQLQNQDPLEPLDATKFTEQLVSYSQVEQQIHTNETLNTLLALAQSTANANAVGYLGKVALTGGPASSLTDGSASWRYTLPTNAASVQLRITDSAGRLVRTLPGEIGAGAHELVWDGTDAAGTALPSGTYALTVAAVAADGSPIAAPTQGMGVVSEVDMSAAEPVLTVGVRRIGLSGIVGLRD